jgi:6-phosphogluconolactonase
MRLDYKFEKMKKSLFAIILCTFGIAYGQSVRNVRYNLLIGTYSTPTSKDGILVYEFNTLSGDFIYRSKTKDIENPSYLDITKDGRFVYSVNEVKTGGVSAFTFNPSNGELTFINRVSSGGDGPCYVTVDDKNKFVFAGNYGSGSLCAIPLKQDGSLGNEIQIIKQEPADSEKERQSGSHVHSTVLSPDNRFLFTPNLGTDKINIYSFNNKNTAEPLSPLDPSFISVKPGTGPRHFTFHPGGKYAYLILEKGCLITAFSYNNGELTEIQSVTMLSLDFSGKVGAADIHISSDGKYLYSSNRGDANEIVIYSIGQDGKLTYKGRQSTLGKTPRNFIIDPSGNFLLVANQGSNEVAIFKRDQKTGLLSPTDKIIRVERPVCLKFASMQNE